MNPRYPLANDPDGNPIELPPEAVAWRVRRRSGKQGRPQCVYDLETGAQLELPLDADLDDLRDYGPGVYRLDAIDKDGKVIPGVIAQTEVPLSEPPPVEPHEPYGSRSEAAALIKHLVDANVRTMEAMASAFGQVRPVEPSSPVVIQPPLPDGGATPSQMEQWMQLAPQIMSMMQMLKTAFTNGAVGASEGKGS